MANNGSEITELAKAGTLNLDELSTMLGESNANASAVTVQDWGITYNSSTEQLSEYCTVVANNPSNPITGIGMIAYSADGTMLYMVQYTNGFSSLMIAPSIGTTLYKPQYGNQALCVVYGWTEQSSFYFTKAMQIGQD